MSIADLFARMQTKLWSSCFTGIAIMLPFYVDMWRACFLHTKNACFLLVQSSSLQSEKSMTR